MTPTFQYVEGEKWNGIYEELQLLAKELENEVLSVFNCGDTELTVDDMMYLKGLKKCIALVKRNKDIAYSRCKLYELGKEKEDVFEYLVKYKSKEETDKPVQDWVEPPMPTEDDYLAMCGNDNKPDTIEFNDNKITYNGLKTDKRYESSITF